MIPALSTMSASAGIMQGAEHKTGEIKWTHASYTWENWSQSSGSPRGWSVAKPIAWHQKSLIGPGNEEANRRLAHRVSAACNMDGYMKKWVCGGLHMCGHQEATATAYSAATA